MDWGTVSEFRELWFPSPRIRLPELGPAGPVLIEGGRCISGALGEYTKLWMSAAGRWHFYYVHPTPRDFFRTVMPDAVPHLLHPGEMTVETFRQGLAYKVVLGLRCAEGPVRVLHLVGDVPDVTRAVEQDEETPVGALGWKGEDMVINNGEPGEISARLFDAITSVQSGREPDTHGWMTTLDG